MNVNQMKLKRVINASGKMSILGVSTFSNDVIEAMREGAQHYYEMDELYKESGKIVAQYLNTESALITNSASSAIALAVAGLVTKDDAYLVEHLHSDPIHKEIIIMKGHMIDYGAPVSTMIHLGGGYVKEVGYANGCTLQQLELAVTEQTVGIIFIQSHHCVQKNMPSLQEVSKLAQEKQIPLILDIAAEETFYKYTNLANLLIISGSKAIEGPTSGIIAGDRQYIKYVQQHYQGIGRAMKIGKEGIFGLLKALEIYKHEQLSKQQQITLLDHFFELEKISGLQVKIHQDESGRNIFRAQIHVDEKKTKYHAQKLTKILQEGDTAIYTRNYFSNVGYFEIDPRSLSHQDVEMIIYRIKQILGG